MNIHIVAILWRPGRREKLLADRADATAFTTPLRAANQGLEILQPVYFVPLAVMYCEGSACKSSRGPPTITIMGESSLSGPARACVNTATDSLASYRGLCSLTFATLLNSAIPFLF